MKKLTHYLLVGLPFILFGQPDHLIFSELILQPSDGEYVTITNPTSSAIDMTNYFITDGTDNGTGKYYYNLPSNADYWSGSSSDFIARFPVSYSIDAGETIFLSLRDNAKYQSQYGSLPDISLDDDLQDAISGTPSKGNTAAPKLGNTTESLILFYWDGTSTTVQDVDYLVWGDNTFAIDKSGVSGYLNDTPIVNQDVLPIHDASEKFFRISDEGAEISTNGNGITGHDETSEPFSSTWTIVSITSPKPEITNLTATPEEPTTSQQITFTVDVSDDDGISSVELVHTFNSVKTVTALNVTTAPQYSTNIDSIGAVGQLSYYVRATDNTGLSDSTNIFALNIVNPPEPPENLSIKDVLDNIDDYVGEIITIDGIVTVPGGLLRTTFTEAFLQDKSERGIILYASMLDTTSFKRGDSILVTGEVDEYNGKPELIYSDVTVLKSNATIPVVEMSLEEFNKLLYDYTYVSVWGKITSRSNPTESNTGANISIQDESGASATVRIWNTTEILYSSSGQLINEGLDTLLQVGKLVTFKGIGGQYQGVGQLQPAFASDIQERLEGVLGDYKTDLTVAPYPFVPQLGEVIQYSYSFPANARIKLRLFDAAGRLVTTIYDEYRSLSFYKGGDETYWNGRDDINQLVPPGVYIMHLEVTDTYTGKLTTDTAPVVIGVYQP
jgi:DNA/RNA endonuclease YhcR with UshA esterase domain